MHVLDYEVLGYLFQRRQSHPVTMAAYSVFPPFSPLHLFRHYFLFLKLCFPFISCKTQCGHSHHSHQNFHSHVLLCKCRISCQGALCVFTTSICIWDTCWLNFFNVYIQCSASLDENLAAAATPVTCWDIYLSMTDLESCSSGMLHIASLLPLYFTLHHCLLNSYKPMLIQYVTGIEVL